MGKLSVIGKKITEYCPLPALIMILLAPIAFIIRLIKSGSPLFSDTLNATVGTLTRFLLAKLTGWLPFSLAESLLLLVPLFILGMIFFIIKISRGSIVKIWRTIFILLSAMSFIYVSFELALSPGYTGVELEKKLFLERRKVSAQELADTAEILNDKLNELSDDLTFIYGSSSVMPYSHNEMVRLLNIAYRSASEKYDFLPSYSTNVKQILLSEPMTYTHISGVYSFFTGEANLNVNYPDYVLPHTAAHEMAHQRGIAREDEANFVAFLVCAESEDPYILYSGYFNLLQSVMSSLYSADSGMYFDFLYNFDNRFRSEIKAYNTFFDKYRENIAADVSQKVNDGYLKQQGQKEGTRSYGMVVDLAVAYFIPASAD